MRAIIGRVMFTLVHGRGRFLGGGRTRALPAG